MSQEFPKCDGTQVTSLVQKVQLIYQTHCDKAIIEHVPDIDTHLTLQEHLWYIALPAILKTGSTLLKGTLAGNIFAVAEQEIPNFPPTQTGEETMDTKKWYASKTIWTNVIAMLWIFVGPVVGTPELSPETNIAILGVINVILRLITKTEVTIL
jgi:hypothetical protein